MPQHPTPPVATRREHVREVHGDRFVDPYEWLRDKADPEVVGYLEAENAYADAMTAHLAATRRSIRDEIAARTQQTDLSVPRYRTHRGGDAWWYYSRTVEGENYPVWCRCPAASIDEPPLAGPGAAEQVLLDGNAAARGQEFFALGGMEVSPSGDRLAYLVDVAGDERFALLVVDIASGQVIDAGLTDLGYGISFADDDTLIFGRVDDAWRQFQVWCHRIGDERAADALLFSEADEQFWVSGQTSRDGRYLVIHSSSKLTGEAWLVPCADLGAAPRCVCPRRDGIDYSVEVAGDRLLVLHNATGVDYELAEAPLDASGPDDWSPVLPSSDGTRLIAVEPYRDFAVVSLRRDGLAGLHVIPRDASGGFLPGADLDFDEPLYDVADAAAEDWDADRIHVQFTSLVTPPSVYECHLADRSLRLLKRTPVLDDPVAGGYDPAAYVQRREWATAADGTRIPISLVHRADLDLDGDNPCLLYGYGAYEICDDPAFSLPRLTLLERGFVFAIAHVRGGGELGRRWYDDGKLHAKSNSFTDFVACARHLVDAGYTRPERLAAEGRSAGGLLMGAIANLAPELFRAVLAGVPFVDALTTMLMPELPLTVGEWEEWGDPVHDAGAYADMKAYSPYENIAATRYPAILATTSFNDTRVLYVEPAKWVAMLRATVAADPTRPVLLKTEMVAGHGGVSGRYARWDQLAFELAWLCDQLGVAS